MKSILAVSLVLLLAVLSASAQRPVEPSAAPDARLPQQEPASAVRDLNDRLKEIAAQSAVTADRSDYHIGPEDLVEITVFEVPELSRTVRVSATGDISLPLVGTLKAAGLSPLQLEDLLKARLAKTYVKDPQVSIFLKEFKSEPVSVMGAVKMPGLHYIQTRKSLIEVLAMAQGLSEGPVKHPGKSIIITRKRPIQAADGTATPDVLEIPIKDLVNSGDPRYNVPVYPGDVVKVQPAGTVYVAGAVQRPGGFPLADFDNVSTIQAVAMAGGVAKNASQSNALVIRLDGRGNRTEQKVNLSRILKGKDADVMLGPNDTLFVPGSVGKESAMRAIEMAISTTTGLIIWRR